MNNKRRKEIETQVHVINKCISDVIAIKDAERFRMSSIPFSLQSSDRYEKMEEAVENMLFAIECLNKSVDYLDSAMD